ncbi:MAG TPA: quinone-dependent dihydroorotate dehydrogenase [Acetobacteraceae bacterium]
MSFVLASALLPLLRRLDPERAHQAALLALRWGFAGRDASADDPALAIEALGQRFVNPIGLAAGFDKNAVALAPLTRLGFGFVETGTVTPRPQPGNPRPRLFRLEEDGAVINRMGFNNAGLDAYLKRLSRRPYGPVVVGANVGINKDAADPERDYPALIAAVSPYADYVAINVSSPNTPGLRDLQGEARLRGILHAVAARVAHHPPLLVKIAPDLGEAALQALVETCVALGVQGLIVSNTTTARPAGLRSPHAREAGGLSGEPLFRLSTRVLAQAFLLAQGRLVLIGAGGVSAGAEALAKIRAGASLVQLYTGFAYAGPAVIPRLKRELAAELRGMGFDRLQDAVGSDARHLAG